MTKVLVLGLDGVCWEFLNPWIEKGYLPNIQKIRNNSSWGNLISVLPPVTCPAWKSYSTGKNPGKMGVFWWVGWDKKKGTLVPPNSNSFVGKDLWDYIGINGGKVAVINMPTTYPPKKVNGIMISGFGSPLDVDFDYGQSYTYPPELQRELEKKFNYKPSIEVLEKNKKDILADQVLSLIESRFKLLVDLLEKEDYDFIHFTLFYINALQHHFGDDDVVLNVWKKVDKWIGKIANYEYNLIFMSDHGMKRVEHSFCINTWLADNGYLFLRDIKKSDALKGVYNKFKPLASFSKKFLPKSIKKIIIPHVDGRIPTMLIDEYIDWNKSKAVALSQGPIYFNETRNDKKELFSELSKKLSKIRVNDKKIIKNIFSKEEVYNGDFTKNAPDMIIEAIDGVEIYAGLTGSQIVNQGDMRGWSTGNHPKGFFIFYGPDFRNLGEIDDLSILDLAPTILNMFDNDIPSDLDGQAIVNILKQPKKPQIKKINFESMKINKVIGNIYHEL